MGHTCQLWRIMIIMNYGDGRIETECKERNLSERGIVGEDLGT